MVTKKDGSVVELPYSVINPELEKCGVPCNETRSICLHDTLGRAFFGVTNACSVKACKRKHGPLPGKGFNIHASKSNTKRGDDEDEKGPSTKKRKKQEAAAKAAAAVTALAQVPGTESQDTSGSEAGENSPHFV